MPDDLHSTKTPFARILRAKQTVLRTLKGETVTVDCGYFALTVTARVGMTTFRIDTGEQFNTRLRTTDFLIAVEEFRHPDSEALFEPQSGFVISRTINGHVHKYQCLAPSKSEPAWRYSDTSLSEFRVHTKLIGEVPA